MPFERFTRSAARTDSDAMWVSVQGNGSISVSYAAFAAIGMPDAVYLLYDKDTRRIALQSASPESRDAYRTRLQGRRSNDRSARVVSASAFFKYIGVDPSQASGRYETQIVDDMITAKLPYTVPF